MGESIFRRAPPAEGDRADFMECGGTSLETATSLPGRQELTCGMGTVCVCVFKSHKTLRGGRLCLFHVLTGELLALQLPRRKIAGK